MKTKSGIIALAAFASLGVADAGNWSGFYIGINAGVDWAKDHATTTPNPTGWTVAGAANIAGLTDGEVKPNGFTGGGQLGVNWQAPGSSFVWGMVLLGTSGCRACAQHHSLRSG